MDGLKMNRGWLKNSFSVEIHTRELPQAGNV